MKSRFPKASISAAVMTGALLVPSTTQANECGPPKRITVRWVCSRVVDVRGEPITGHGGGPPVDVAETDCGDYND